MINFEVLGWHKSWREVCSHPCHLYIVSVGWETDCMDAPHCLCLRLLMHICHCLWDLLPSAAPWWNGPVYSDTPYAFGYGHNHLICCGQSNWANLMQRPGISFAFWFLSHLRAMSSPCLHICGEWWHVETFSSYWICLETIWREKTAIFLGRVNLDKHSDCLTQPH